MNSPVRTKKSPFSILPFIKTLGSCCGSIHDGSNKLLLLMSTSLSPSLEYGLALDLLLAYESGEKDPIASTRRKPKEGLVASIWGTSGNQSH